LSGVREHSPASLQQTDLQALRGAGFAESPLAADTLARLSALNRLDVTGVSLNGRALPPSLRGLKELRFYRWAPDFGGGRAALAPGVTFLECTLTSDRHLDGLAAAFPAVTRLELTLGDWSATSPQAAAVWRGLRSLRLYGGGEVWSGVLGLLRGGDRGLQSLTVHFTPPKAHQLAEALRLAPALGDLWLELPPGGNLAGLFAPLLAAPPPAAGAGPTPPPPPPGQRLERLVINVFYGQDLQGVTVDGLLAVGRALPALRSLEIRLNVFWKDADAWTAADFDAEATLARLLTDLEAAGRGGGGGGGEPAEADAPTPGGPPPTFSNLLPAVRAALARLAAAQGA
jgi:hypothetical protein